MDLYAENILDHYRHPRHCGHLSSPSVSHREENISCGDDLTLELTIDGDMITQVSWSGTGCAISQAAMSMLAEELSGMRMDDACVLKPQHVYDLLGVPIGPRRFKCALLGLHTLKNALCTHAHAPLKSWVETVAVEGD